jgi:hypothetical protein
VPTMSRFPAGWVLIPVARKTSGQASV